MKKFGRLQNDRGDRLLLAVSLWCAAFSPLRSFALFISHRVLAFGTQEFLLRRSSRMHEI